MDIVKKRFEVIRMDALTRKKYPLEQLLRFVKVEDRVIFDPEKKIEGRGFYLYAGEKEIVDTFHSKKISKLINKNQQESLLKEILSYVRKGN